MKHSTTVTLMLHVLTLLVHTHVTAKMDFMGTALRNVQVCTIFSV